MSDFDLIKQLQNPEQQEKSLLPRGLKYKYVTVMVENVEKEVHIPAREYDKFLEATTDKNLSSYEFSTLLREVRGIRG